MVKVPGFIKNFEKSHPDIYGFIKDVIFSLAVVAVVAIALYLYAGMWPPMVSVNGVSMLPHLETGDLIFIQGLDRGNVSTYDSSVNTSYSTFGEPGNVIVYEPYGNPSLPLVIHRAMYWVNQGDPMWAGGPPAPWGGYITLGDNNKGIYDQEAYSICYEQPVKPSWILGIARYKVPYLGYLRSII
jgi:signal peptidase